MSTLIIDVASEDEALAQAIAAIERNEPQPPRYLSCSQEDLLDTLTGNRFALLKALAGAGPLGVREPARRTGRDVRVVHADAKERFTSK
ncbi:transcriptional regulator [uncultured Thiocystis sp.]|jgi:predicted transcriptional regulator|uniref:HVO_A0114 family putative DNA-binding protein n=1 Tax=uncultured Thiocystis sp. TaxID=1202134 RepID=UPI0025FE945F|nr:transcriptional regulator [uncultured Thiocystis sp.]